MADVKEVPDEQTDADELIHHKTLKYYTSSL